MKKCLLLILLLLFTSGCISRQDLSSIIFVDCIAIDYTNGLYHVYVHTTNPNTLTTTEQGSTTIENKYSVASSESSSIFAGLKEISDTSSLKLSFNQIQSLIISKSFFQYDKLLEIYHFIKDFPQIYPLVNVFVCENEISDLLKIDNPENISPFFSILGIADKESSYNYTTYPMLTNSLLEVNKIIKIPIVQSVNNVWSDGKDKLISSQIIGNAYLSKDNSSLFIYEKDNHGIIWLENLNNQQLEISDNIILSINKHTYNKHINEDSVFINIDIDATVSKNNNTIEELTTLIKSTIESELQSLYLYCCEEQIDIFEINDLLYRYNKLQLRDAYKNNTIKFNINVNLSTLK